MNIILSIENKIIMAGLSAIIQDGILGSYVINLSKSEIMNSANLYHSDVVIIEVKGKDDFDLNLINHIENTEKKIQTFFFTYDNLDKQTINLIKGNGANLIYVNQSLESIVNQIKFSLRYYLDENGIKKRKQNKLQTLNGFLSKRELEIGMLLVKGESISTISQKKNLAISTVSTYKKRIYLKTNVKNIIEMSHLFTRAANQFKEI